MISLQLQLKIKGDLPNQVKKSQLFVEIPFPATQSKNSQTGIVDSFSNTRRWIVDTSLQEAERSVDLMIKYNATCATLVQILFSNRINCLESG